MTPPKLTLISHHLCPYVQRAVIALTEKSVPFERRYIDLANKPDWFLAVSPLGKTPVLMVGDHAIFESAVILEYLEDTQTHPLHPADPLARAEHRGWVEFNSAVLADIWGMETAAERGEFEAKVGALSRHFAQIERRLGDGPYFDGERFSLVDAVFGPAFRYFDLFDKIGDFGIFTAKPKLSRWRQALSFRPSILGAVTEDYEARLRQFLNDRGSYLAKQMTPALP
jgi:glutathione S-transferase